ncbi:hypothetical protein HCB69_16010 [Listeria booriae]|uniref:dUTPase n=1 Tax=Listeria booriae TaxID=1552123 RepID=A0A842G8R6_9LIST|nr:dUTP diphosphatase [Listeria booriae]MBC2285881.1 hypothetical protein [Listeria booriae]
MNIIKMLEMQNTVDTKILEKCKLSDDELFINLSIALVVEVAELANELQDFKHWKHSKKIDLIKTKEELADCIAFALALVNLDKEVVTENDIQRNFKMIDQIAADPSGTDFNDRLSTTSYLLRGASQIEEYKRSSMLFSLITFGVVNLGMSLNEIEDEYMKKSQINIQRQENNY